MFVQAVVVAPSFVVAMLVGPSFASRRARWNTGKSLILASGKSPANSPTSTLPAKERALIEARRGELYRLAIALHMGFIRMSGRTLDAYGQVPKVLWNHLGAQLELDPPDLGRLRTLYETRARTLIDHQVLAYQALGFRPMAEHQRRYVVRWLKERLTGRPDRGDLLYELKRWFYEHRILIVHDRLLRRLIMGVEQAEREFLS